MPTPRHTKNIRQSVLRYLHAALEGGTGAIGEAELRGIIIGKPDLTPGDYIRFNDPPLRL